MKTYFIPVLLLVFCFSGSYAQSPFLHFKPDKVDPASVTSHGKSDNGNAVDTTQSFSMINYNPALAFDGEDDYLEYNGKIKDLSNATVFTVFRSDNDTLQEAEIWGMFGETSALGLTTKRIISSKMQSNYEGISPGNVTLHVFTEANRSGNGSVHSNSLLSVGVVRKESSNTYLKGSLAEIIAFDKRLRGDNRQILESTLAIKYGITLNKGEDYMLSKRRIVWDADENKEFSYNIAGIGRDNSQDVYQKQSTSSNDPGFLVIGVDSIVKSNTENNGKIKNRQFLLWGDNHGPLMESKDNNPEGKVPMLQRKWLVKSTGNKSDEINTQLIIDANKLFGGLGAKEDYSLIIDRSGNGDFDTQNCSYISPSELSAEGILTFNNVKWDIDGSGKDIFSFSLRKDLVATLSGEEATICNEGATVLNYDREGGIPPYSYDLTNASGFTKNWKSDQDKGMDYSLSDIPAGVYTLTITDYTGTVSKAEYTIEEEPLVIVDLGPDKFLESKEKSLTLKPQISNKEKVVSYQWTGEQGFSSDQESISIDKPGSYTLTLTTETGCTCSDTIFISDTFVQEFSLYPNPAPGGEYSISVELTENSDISVRVYNLLGVLVYEYKAEDKSQLNIKPDAIGSSGLYTVVLETSKGRVSTKLLVK